MSSTSDSDKPGRAPQRHGRIIRPLGHLERWLEVQYLLDQYRGTAVACRYAIPSLVKPAGSNDLALAKDRFTLAVARTVLDHTLLQVGRIDTDKRVAKFVELDAMNLDHHIVWNEGSPEGYDERFGDQMTAELDGTFDHAATKPAWRLIVTRPDGQDWLDAIFSFRHTLGDGMSAKLFHQTLLKHLNRQPAPSDASEVPMAGHILKLNSQPRVYPPPIQKMAKFIVPKKWAVKVAWDEFRPDSMVPKEEKQVRAAWAPFVGAGQPVKTAKRRVLANSQTTNSLLAQCRKHDTTITGLAMALMLISAARQVPEEKAPGFTTRTAVDLRRFMPPEVDAHNTFANILSSREFILPPAHTRSVRQALESGRDEEVEAQIWSVAKAVRRDLEKRLGDKLCKEAVGLMPLVRDWRDEFESEKKKMRKITLHISNLGVLDGDPAAEAEAGRRASSQEERWKVVRADFAIPGEACGPLVNASIISVKGHEMVLELTWQTGSGGDLIGDGIAEDIGLWFDKLAGTGVNA